ncbi:MAG: hypothetical protein BAA04_09790 [Firmicutes bacterium ZCTH02-B6]|nr:MAG: hypothetical protein BAA04_09790 [Firmicutes bacterium ZCTH02-B6]
MPRRMTAIPRVHATRIGLEGVAVEQPYLCPVCRDNRQDFLQVYKLAREIRKDPETGAILYVADEWETVTRDGRLDLEIRCRLCDHSAPEVDFVRAARRDMQRAMRPKDRRA